MNSEDDKREAGNELFRNGKFLEAIEMYTEAIKINPHISILFSNRANCYLKMENYQNSFEDASKAIEIDEKNIKAYLICGKALVKISEENSDLDSIEKAIKRITKAYTLAHNQGKMEYLRELKKYILYSKKVLWEKSMNYKIENMKNLKTKITSFINNDQTLEASEKLKFLETVYNTKEVRKPTP